MKDGGKVALLLLGLGGLVAGVLLLTRKAEELPEEEEEVIDAVLESGYVYWVGIPEWKGIHTRYPNEWPLDTDITFAWTIENTGNVGAYFQVYMIAPGDWFYLDPGDEVQVFEEFHTPAVPVTPGYTYYRINILAKKLDGERIGAVWTSDEIEVTYS